MYLCISCVMSIQIMHTCIKYVYVGHSNEKQDILAYSEYLTILRGQIIFSKLHRA